MSDFTLTKLRRMFGLTQQRLTLFADIPCVEGTPWLTETLRKGRQLIVDTEKARSELIVTPILLTIRELQQNRFAIYSGETFDVEPEKGLNGECDFILTDTPPLQELQAPVMMIVEAKKNDIESGFGQCAAQLLAAQIFNQRDQVSVESLFGCVTTGEAWHFLKLAQKVIVIDQERYYLDQLPAILGIFQMIFAFYKAQLAANKRDN